MPYLSKITISDLNAYFVLIIILVMTGSCSTPNFNKLKEPSVKTQNSASNSTFKMNGFYYHDDYWNKTRNSHYSLFRTEYYYPFIYIFYEDGTFFNGMRSERYVEWIENESPACLIDDDYRDCEFCWGHYQVYGDTIKIKTFSRHRFGDDGPEINEEWVLIENDTTLRSIMYVPHNSETGPRRIIYPLHFKTCANKPDSSNVLFEYLENQ